MMSSDINFIPAMIFAAIGLIATLAGRLGWPWLFCHRC